MDAAEQARRWASAKAKLAAAQLCSAHQFYSESTTLSYYACYQAMWVAVGDPVAGLWRHGGLINEFCRGRWTTPGSPPTALAMLRKKLDRLYLYRIQSDYEARQVGAAEAQEGINTAKEVLQVVAQHIGLVL